MLVDQEDDSQQPVQLPQHQQQNTSPSSVAAQLFPAFQVPSSSSTSRSTRAKAPASLVSPDQLWAALLELEQRHNAGEHQSNRNRPPGAEHIPRYPILDARNATQYQGLFPGLRLGGPVGLERLLLPPRTQSPSSQGSPSTEETPEELEQRRQAALAVVLDTFGADRTVPLRPLPFAAGNPGGFQLGNTVRIEVDSGLKLWREGVLRQFSPHTGMYLVQLLDAGDDSAESQDGNSSNSGGKGSSNKSAGAPVSGARNAGASSRPRRQAASSSPYASIASIPSSSAASSQEQQLDEETQQPKQSEDTAPAPEEELRWFDLCQLRVVEYCALAWVKLRHLPWWPAHVSCSHAHFRVHHCLPLL